mgnify:CR=1 FL=1|tara:strand:- start:12163 stop:13305 length:1143 start_codon:yes stop_codon:yes gene_type:complete
MSDDRNESEVVTSVEEEQVDALVENEILDEESLEETYGKDKKKVNAMKYNSKEEPVDEEEEDEEEVKEDAPTVDIPKTKAGVIQATVDMLKKAKSEDAKKMFSKLVTIDSEPANIKSEKDAEKAVSTKMPEPKAKAKVEAMDFDDDIDAIIKEEATLSDGFRGKASAIFEAVLTSKLSEEVDRLEAEYAQNLEEEVSEVHSSLVEKVDSYLNYVVEGWMEDNQLQVQEGLRTEIAEEFMTSLQSVFKEHYIEVPEGKEDLVDDLSEQVSELEDTLNKTTDDNIKLHAEVQNFEKQAVVREQSLGLAETEAEKLASLVEDIDFDTKETFEMKVKTVKESYFTKEVTESVDEVDSLLGDGTVESDVSDTMARYGQAITNFNN